PVFGPLKKRLTAALSYLNQAQLGKRVVLKGHFHISTQELHDAVVAAEIETKQHARKKVKKSGKTISYEAKSEKDTEEEGKEDIETDIED
ncbi:hypothetical protein V1524DRAFT_412283, partial [Lipomyces starkeyi]